MTTINLTEATIAKLDLGPDDIVVISITDENRRITREQGDVLRQDVRKFLGADREVIVLPYGIELEIIRPDEVPPEFDEADGFA